MDGLGHYLVESNMKKLDKQELLIINGGAISGTLINSIIRGVGVIVDLGRSFGTALRRIFEKKICLIK
jgi:Ni,Fe-hydrogenase maturation factor